MDEREIKGIKIWKLLFILSFVFFGVSVYFYIFNMPHKKNEQLVNNNYSSQLVNDIMFDKIKIYNRGNKYYFTARAINKTNNNIKVGRIEIHLDSYKFYSFIGDNLSSDEYKMIFMETNKDLSDIKNIIFLL